MDPAPAQHTRIIVAADPVSGAFSATVDGIVVPNPSGGWQDAFSSAFAVVAQKARQRGEPVDAVVSTSDWTGRFHVHPDGSVAEHVAPPLPEPRERRRRPPLLAVLVPLTVLAVAAGVVATSVAGVTTTDQSSPTAAGTPATSAPAVQVPDFGTPTPTAAQPVAPANPVPTSVPELPTTLPEPLPTDPATPRPAPAPPLDRIPSPQPAPQPAPAAPAPIRPRPAQPVEPIIAPRAPAVPQPTPRPDPTPPAQAEQLRTVQVGDGAGNCLSGSAGSVRSAPCDAAAADQRWTITASGRLSHGSSCLAAVPLQSLVMQACGSPTDTGQTWKASATGIANGRSTQCIVVRGHDGRQVSVATGACGTGAAKLQDV